MSITLDIIFLKLRAYLELMKLRLAWLVAFSGAFGYSLGIDKVEWLPLTIFLFAAFCITGAANIINQIIEIDLDKLMKRTQNRPLPSGRVSVQEAVWVAITLFVVSTIVFFVEFNLRACALAVLSTILYGFVYTPLKKVGPIAVFVGAIPGAFPPMIGWVAATNQFGLEPGILFAIQFIWQFPHFWAISWVLD